MTRRARDRTAAGLTAVLAVLVVVEVFLPYEKALFAWHRLPGFDALIGIGACLGVVLASKALGRMFLQRPEGTDD